MIKVNQPIVVEGRYDKIRLASVVDAVIIETGGFRIFKDKELVAALRALAQEVGLVIMTDSDAAGFKIRSHLKNVLGQNAKLTHVYVPAVLGKERRKAAPSAEGLLGVEGLSQADLIAAFEKAGVGCAPCESAGEKITTADLFALGLTGGADSAQKRRQLLDSLRLPPRLSTNSMLDMLNLLFSRQEFLNRF